MSDIFYIGISIALIAFSSIVSAVWNGNFEGSESSVGVLIFGLFLASIGKLRDEDSKS